MRYIILFDTKYNKIKAQLEVLLIWFCNFYDRKIIKLN